jgi:predicted nucleic acid-binding protein
LLERIVEEGTGAISTQIIVEFYAAATRELGISSREAEQILADLGGWTIPRLTHAEILLAARLHRRYQTSWWDALVLQSSQALGCDVLWTEDPPDGQRYGQVTVRNPFSV